MMRPNFRAAHAFDHGPRHVEQRIEIGVDHGMPLLGGHAVKGAVAGDPGIVDQNFDGAEICLDLFQAGGAGLGVRDIPFVNRNSGFGFEGVGGFVIAGVSGGHLVARRFQRF